LKANESDPENGTVDPEIVKEMSCVKGYEYQCEMIEDNLLNEIDQVCQRNQSLVVEGVHLCESVANKLFKKYEHCIPFMIYVNDADQHMQRFGSRCEGGSIDPAKNRYVKNFRNIRAIQRAIIQNPIDSKFIKTDNDDAKKTLSLVTTCIRKYLKKLMELSYVQRQNLVVDRKRNILNDRYEKSLQQILNQNKEKVESTKQQKEKSSKSPKDEGNLQWVYRKSRKEDSKYWFLRHEKLFHMRTKKNPLVPPPESRRAKSAKKKNKFKAFSTLEVDDAKLLKRKFNGYRHQKSIFDAIRKYGKNSTKSKMSESTACTITKIKACD
jgi:hypothetical protein